MRDSRSGRLWHSIAWPFFLFVVTGSIVLVLWLQLGVRRESRAVFTALARTNAAFVRNAHLPETPQMMEYLGRLLNLKAYLRTGGRLVPEPKGDPGAAGLARVEPGHGVRAIGDRYEAVAMPVEPGRDLLLVRPAEPLFGSLWRVETVVALGIFWALSIALAWSMARGVVRPIRLLALRLPHIETDPAGTLPGAERTDELGDLARAYLEAREQIATEREKRQEAERMALLGRMTTSLAHEIHNPIFAIRMHAQLLQSAAPPGLPAAFIPTLLEETGRIESLVNQWMYLTRPEPPSMSVVLADEILSQTVNAQSAVAAHAGVSIAMDVAPGLEIAGDRRRLAQAFTNIVVNAIQAMPRGGELKVHGSGEWKSIVLVFEDGGTGFSPEALKRHRELFFSEKEGGMGIGLSVTAEILEAHGGRLEVANGAIRGGRVTLYIPRTARTGEPP